MLTSTDYDKLQQIMQESPEHEALISGLLKSHRMEVSAISHEIRNPLTLVYSTLQLIESTHPEVHTFAHWQELHQDIEYMKELLEELSSYNNSERLDPVTVDTSLFFRRLSLSFASSIVDTDIEFTSLIPEDLPPVSLDSTKMRQALLNLLRNAHDACIATSHTDYDSSDNANMTPHRDAANYTDTVISPETVSPAITLSVSPDPQDDSLLCITITDNGCGIRPEDQDSIFEPFITHKADGTGLGLAITRRIILAHHGTITLDSTPGTGTTFSIALPIQKNA